jgi:hypothetical protein
VESLLVRGFMPGWAMPRPLVTTTDLEKFRALLLGQLSPEIHGR